MSDLGILTTMINSIIGSEVFSEKQMNEIMTGAAKAKERGGMNAVIEYLMKITKTDVDAKELKDFATKIKDDPMSGFDLLKKKKF